MPGRGIEVGLTGGRNAEDDYMSQSYSYRLTEEYLDESKKRTLNNMDHLIDNESKSYYEDFLGLSHLIERRDYIKENGFIPYGAVVTGPVKELLKLKEQPQLKAPILGDMHYWNWRKE
ncbi:anti sigma factor C-terminal domain-containing protein [Bacillus sp. CRN 9]|nr:anti sigma factor C-terminal domain-containing protein [Bacillus sp. CRN 9]